MSDLLHELEHIASEDSQQDWMRLEYGEIHRKAFIRGGEYIGSLAADTIEQQQQRIAELERYNVRLANESHEKDLKIDELAATVERLKAQQPEVAARAVEDAVMNTPTHRMKVDERLYHSRKALLDYANQLREQSDE